MSSIGRRSFLKLSALGKGSAAGVGVTSAFGSNDTLRKATSEEIENPFPNLLDEKNNLLYLFSWLWCGG